MPGVFYNSPRAGGILRDHRAPLVALSHSRWASQPCCSKSLILLLSSNWTRTLRTSRAIFVLGELIVRFRGCGPFWILETLRIKCLTSLLPWACYNSTRDGWNSSGPSCTPRRAISRWASRHHVKAPCSARTASTTWWCFQTGAFFKHLLYINVVVVLK